MKNRTRLLLVAAAALVLVGAGSFSGRWFEIEEIRLSPLDQAPLGSCSPEGALIYVKADGGHLCVCTRDPDDLGDPDLDWLRADGGGECPDQVPIFRQRRWGQ